MGSVYADGGACRADLFASGVEGGAMRRKNTIAGGQQFFNPRCGICKRYEEPYTRVVFVRETRRGVIVRCENCGNESYRQSISARRLARAASMEVR